MYILFLYYNYICSVILGRWCRTSLDFAVGGAADIKIIRMLSDAAQTEQDLQLQEIVTREGHVSAITWHAAHTCCVFSVGFFLKLILINK